MPKYKRIDKHTIQIIVEKATNLDLAGLIKGKEQLIQQREDLINRIKNINEILAEAKRLGIKPRKPNLVKKIEKKEK